MKSYFVTGTDTDAGKTLIASALLLKAQQNGLATLGLKPVAAGGAMDGEQLCNEDALLLMAQSSVKLPYELVNPVLLREPMAPHIAAQREGKRLSADKIVGFYRGAVMGLRGETKPDLCLVEGAGGWRVPLNNSITMAEVAKLLQLPVVLVVGLKLGCLNHAILTAEAIARDGLVLAGWVASQTDPQMTVVDENLTTLARYINAPCLGFVPPLADPSPEAAADFLNIDPLGLAG